MPKRVGIHILEEIHLHIIRLQLTQDHMRIEECTLRESNDITKDEDKQKMITRSYHSLLYSSVNRIVTQTLKVRFDYLQQTLKLFRK